MDTLRLNKAEGVTNRMKQGSRLGPTSEIRFESSVSVWNKTYSEL
jgi:hypothetical protein